MDADNADFFALDVPGGQIRRLTMLFIDVVDSTALSCRVEPETYRTVVGRCRELVLKAAQDLRGRVAYTKGDGLLVMFGHPVTHDNDVQRAVSMGLRVTDEVARLSKQVDRRFGFTIAVRVGVHRGMVYLDPEQDDVCGGAVHLTQWVSAQAEPGTVVASDAVASLVRNQFELALRTTGYAKGTETRLAYHRVVGKRVTAGRGANAAMVGHHRERAWLATSWERAQAHTLAVPVVALRGGPGLGKSRLAAVAADLARMSARPVMRWNGSALHTDTCLHPIRGLIENSTVPERPGDVTQAMVDAIGERVLGLFEDGAGLLIADDAHWFDAATVRVLESVLAQAQGRLLVLITTRNGLTPLPDRAVKVFDLQPLTDAETDSLVKILAPSLPEPVRTSVRQRSDGIPLYIEQIVADAARIDAQPAAGAHLAVPDTLYDALLSDLDIGAPALPVLQAAAVIGRHVERRLLKATLGLRDAELDDVVHELEDRDILAPCGLDGWRFRRELVREIATELTPPSVLRELNARLAEFLSQTAAGAADWQCVGARFERAELLDAAAAAFARASECQANANRDSLERSIA